MASSDSSARQERKERYERALRTVAENTTDAQRPGVSASSLWITLTDSVGMSATEAQLAVRAAHEQDDLLRWEDRDGVVRYTRTTNAALKRLIGAENQRDHPDVGLIERAAEHIGGDA